MLLVLMIINIVLAIPLHGQQKLVPDCIAVAAGNCRSLGIEQVSAVNAVNTVTVNAPNVSRILALYSVCSGGTAAVTVSVSVNGQTYYVLDTLTAAATVLKQYDPGAMTTGQGLAVSPLAFQWIRVSVASCGAGNTNTLLVTMK
jgi:hypothetical protein